MYNIVNQWRSQGRTGRAQRPFSNVYRALPLKLKRSGYSNRTYSQINQLLAQVVLCKFTESGYATDVSVTRYYSMG